MKALKTLAAAALLASTSYAFAAVTFDSATGTGFVGKGDVQLAFGWNNKQLQDNAGGVTFKYEFTETYEAVCTWTTGEGKKGEKTHNVSHTTSSSVASTLDYEPRTKNQISGFSLNGIKATIEFGTVPEVGQGCMGNEGHDGVWTSVSKATSTGGLFVTYGGNSAPLWTN